MRRICLLLTDLEIGGTPTVVRELALRLRDRGGAHVEVVGLSKSGPLHNQLRELGIKCTALGAAGARDLPRTVRRLVRLLKQERIDTVASFLIHANFVAACARLLHPAAWYLQSIQTTQPAPRWHWAIQRLISPAADRFFVPSKSVARVARRWAGITDKRVVVIPNVVDLCDCGEAHKPAHNKAFSVGFIGRLDPIKRIPDLLRAMTLLRPATELHIYGEGRERPRIEAEIARLGLQSRVILHGAIERPREALGTVDVLVLPSAAEGFGLVLIEAMAVGVPVVATNVAGICDVVRDGITGLLVPVRSPAELALAIDKVRTDADLRRRLTEAGHREVSERFSWDAAWESYAKLFGLRRTSS